MARRRLIWQLYPSYLVVTLLALFAVSIYASQSMRRFYQQQVFSDLEAGALLVQKQVADMLEAGDYPGVDRLCKELGKKADRRITVILPDGTVTGDSEEDPAEMDDHSNRPEVIAAIKGVISSDVRISPTLGVDMMYVAVPLMADFSGGEVEGVIRMSVSVASIKGALQKVYFKVFVGGAVVLVIAAVITLFFSRKISRPLEKIKYGAEQFADGDLSHKLKVQGCEEFASLAEAMNKMAGDLDLRIKEVNQLENMRRNFVANVSHELKTPITSIKGFVETLLDGAIKDEQEARRFLRIIGSHSNRLNSIIEDLLSLSRLEAGEEKHDISFENVRLKNVVAAAVRLSKFKADEKGVEIEFKCDKKIRAEVNAALIEQAVVNLIDNAVKYTRAGKKVTVNVTRDKSEVAISVKDQGCGIDESKLAHIFERFYVVDKARSRKLGGTGLGLAIVKHIAQAHGGTITVTSTPGKGSVFVIHIPELN